MLQIFTEFCTLPSRDQSGYFRLSAISDTTQRALKNVSGNQVLLRLTCRVQKNLQDSDVPHLASRGPVGGEEGYHRLSIRGRFLIAHRGFRVLDSNGFWRDLLEGGL